MVTIYPTKVEHTTQDKILNTSCCQGRGYGTQKLYDKDRIKNGNKTFGSWGTTAARVNNSPHSIATPSGTRRQPEEIIVTSWDTDSIPDKAQITAVTVEVAYYTDKYDNYDKAGYFPDSTVIKLLNKDGKKIKDGKIAGPTTTLKNQSVTFSSLNLSPSELKKSQVSIQVGENKRTGVECRVKIQYLRMNVAYINPDPEYQITLSHNGGTQHKKNAPYTYTVEIKNNKKEKKKSTCYVTVPSGSTVTNLSNITHHKNNTYAVSVNTDNSTSVKATFNISHNNLGTQTVSAYMTQYGKNKPSASTNVIIPTTELSLVPIVHDNIENMTIQEPYVIKEGHGTVKFQIHFSRNTYIENTTTEYFELNTAGLITDWNTDQATYRGNGIWLFNKIPKGSNSFTVTTPEVNLDNAGTFTVSSTYYSIGEEINKPPRHEYIIKVKSTPLQKNYFKLRLEDGTDVQYNALNFAQGDDLQNPLTYTDEDYTPIKAEDFIINGETKRIPVDEAEYLSFDMQLKKKKIVLENNKESEEDVEVENVLAYIEVVNDDGEDCSDTIVGIDNNGTLFEGNGKKYCLIKKISSSEITTLKLVVLSDTEQECTIRVRPYNYNLYDTGEWKPGKAVFKDIPNIKIHIEGDKNDISSGEEFELYYCVQNKSDIEGKDIKFKIKEPYGFDILETSNVSEDYYNEGTSFDPSSKGKRIWKFTTLPANSQEYVLAIKYRANKKGIYDFIMETVDNTNTTEDDQHKNIAQYQVMVDIISKASITTHVNYSQPEVNQLIDYVITVTNELKHQDTFYFDITDIGDYAPNHSQSHYIIEHVKMDKGVFKTKEELNEAITEVSDEEEEKTVPNNTIGRWELTDIPVNSTYKLTLSLRPTATGLHTIKTVFTNPQKNGQQNGEQIFTNRVKVLNSKKQIEFNVYHAVNDDDIDCNKITDDNLDIICDNDYINLSDSIYYIIEIKNNSRLELNQPINIYARLPQSFLENPYCGNPEKFIQDKSTGLLNYQLQSLPGCQSGPTKIYLKAKPSQIGEFTTNFMLSTKTADVLHKSLHLTVDEEFNQRELEHEIKIYNFDKTNKYYRYEIDNQGEIFKFFNTGDKTLRPIEKETYHIDNVEKYVGSNLKEIVRDIKRNSKYVDPVFLREGSNKLQDKGYELYPDGLIRRFGLLNSEVFHYVNQLPTTSDLIEATMRWDVDEWDTKMWAGGDYDNGVFDLTVDYEKIPSNFDIPNATSLVKNLQTIVDNTRPYGTKGRCYCSATTTLNFGFNIKDIQTQMQYETDLLLNLNDIYLLTTFNRSDNSLVYFHDKIQYDIDFILKTQSEYERKAIEEDRLKTGVDADVVNVCVYESSMKKVYIEDITDILNNLYNYNTNTNNIDITIPYNNFTSSSSNLPYLDGYQSFTYTNNHNSNQLTGLSIQKGKNINIKLGYIEEDYFKGFVLKLNNTVMNKRLIRDDVEKFTVMSQTLDTTDDITIHFWVSTNEQEFYHIGFITFTQDLISNIEDNTTDEDISDLASNTENGTQNIINTEITNTSQITYLKDEQTECTYGHYHEGTTKTPVTFKISNNYKTKTKQYNKIITEDRWYNLDKINNNGYAAISYNSKVDKECNDKAISAPILTAKYDNIGLSRLDEVVDIDFKITAQSNKDNFANDININILPNGDYYYPTTGVARQIYYPNKLTNTKRQMFTSYIIEQPNLTICSDCLKTSLGYHDACPHCNSENISHHKEVQPVTICDTCGHVTKGTYPYCHYCLSQNVENVDVDYNKTYCYRCEKLFDDYYQYCPNCFSSNTVYLDNKKTAYTLEKDSQNIEPIVINTQNTDEINIFNIEIPFSQNSDLLKELNKLVLNVDCTNANDGKYYYCKDCQVGGLGNFEVCPNCGSHHVINKEVPKNTIEAYININTSITRIELNDNNTLETGDFIKQIDLLPIANDVKGDKFTIRFYINNTHVDENIKAVDKLPINDKYKDIILNSINKYDLTINNLYVDYDFIKVENEWQGLSNLFGEDHTGVTYTFENEEESEDLVFKDFNIPRDKYSHAFLHLGGVCKSSRDYNINLEIQDKNYRIHEYSITNIKDTLFNREIDLLNIVDSIEDIEITIRFEGLGIESVVLTECDILTEKERTNILKQAMTDVNIEYKEVGDVILLQSDNMWGLKDIAPGYVSGRTLESNLLCYFDFGSLHSSEYIRVYDIDMIVYYQSKTGKITTESIPVYDDNKVEQYITGEAYGENWGFIEEDYDDLDNLEYVNVYVDEKGNLLNALSLNKKIAQSFICNQNDISKINVEYFGKKGYPSDIINIYLCDDYNNEPNNIVAYNQIRMPNKKEIINVDFDINELNIGQRYWIVLEDNNADTNNYHRFNFNSENIGTLIIGNKKTTAQALCFSIQYPYKTPYYHLPIMWTVTNETSSVELTETKTDSFFYDEDMDSYLILKVLKKNGNPNHNITCYIYDDEERTNKIDTKAIELKEYRSNVYIDISALEKNKEYYIEIIPTEVDDKNYFVLYYDDDNHTMIANMNPDTEYDEAHTDSQELKAPENKSNDNDISYKMANILYRYNIKSSNTSLSKIIIKNGYNIEC